MPGTPYRIAENMDPYEPDLFHGMPSDFLWRELMRRGVINDDTPEDPDLARAREEMHGGRPAEAIVWLERFLGHEWIGTLSHV